MPPDLSRAICEFSQFLSENWKCFLLVALGSCGLVVFISGIIVGKMVHENQIKLSIKDGKVFCNLKEES